MMCSCLTTRRTATRYRCAPWRCSACSWSAWSRSSWSTSPRTGSSPAAARTAETRSRPVPEIELDLGAQLIASLEGMTARLDREERQRQAIIQAVRQIPLTAPQANAAGLIDYPDLLAAKTGYYWGVRRLTLTGF